MARINFEDDVESREEFRKLVKLLGGDDDRARGMLIRFWRIAQRHWAEFQLVPPHEMELGDFQPLIDSRWSILFPDGYTEKDGTQSVTTGFYAIGSEERFAWYRQKCLAGKKGGRPRKPDETETSAPVSESDTSVNRKPDSENRESISENPPSPVPAPVPAPAQKAKTKNTTTTIDPPKPDLTKLPAEVAEAWTYWADTLKRFNIVPRPMNLAQQESIARAIRQLGFENACDALRGARYDEADQKSGYDPKKHLSLDRVLHRNPKTGVSNWERLGNLWRAKHPTPSTNSVQSNQEDDFEKKCREVIERNQKGEINE